MTRRHRWAHGAVWPVLALVVSLGFGLALYLRPPPPGASAEIGTVQAGPR
jgi:hypothetical protein